mmetsp:Transcript_119786/g.284603  ORF Transcript_119786/g.284603 Transcript_119786/m.284603 type:complete len:101 (+) Transcript_119786:49-351(+)
MSSPDPEEGKGEKEDVQESTWKVVFYGFLDVVAVLARGMATIGSFFLSLLRSCCYPVKETCASCADRMEKWKRPYTAKDPVKIGVPQFTYGTSYGSSRTV